VSLDELIVSRKSAMTVAQVAEILSVSERLIYQLVAAGEVPHFRIGAAVRFEPKTLSAWLNEKLQASSKSLRSRADGRNPQTGATVAHHLDDVWRAILFPRPRRKKST
jgi:excisionase family DNA binding protein